MSYPWMKKTLKISLIVAVLSLIGIQFIRPERSNPPVDPGLRLEASNDLPGDVKRVLKRSCYDCHSHETVYPWYSNVAPLSWGMVDHIRHGRDELNFSVWNTYSVSRKERKLEEICEEITERKMPHSQYLWLHWDAALSEEEISALCDWTKSAANQLKVTLENDG